MVICKRCNKENQEHYKFCLGCGAELPKQEGSVQKDFKVPTPPSGFSPAAASGIPPQASVSPARAGTDRPGVTATPVVCPGCSANVPAGFRFCGGCGHPIAEASLRSMPVVSSASEASLVLIRPDGSDGESFVLDSDTATVGRKTGSIFGNDSYLSPMHATFTRGGSDVTVTDESSLNGVFLRITPNSPIELGHGAMFRIGQEIIRVEKRDATAAASSDAQIMGSPSDEMVGRILTVVGRDTISDAFPIPRAGLHLGRERGDVVFPDDGYVSGLHCRLHEEGGKIMLTDVGSSNGTYVRIPSGVPVSVQSGELMLMGQQLFRIVY
ncbi:MAG: FHA domain-containing protein [Myxococcales bacterium]|nr:MAG: FHA domain-containing protein [Myxococcales bacterium]